MTPRNCGTSFGVTFSYMEGVKAGLDTCLSSSPTRSDPNTSKRTGRGIPSLWI